MSPDEWQKACAAVHGNKQERMNLLWQSYQNLMLRLYMEQGLDVIVLLPKDMLAEIEDALSDQNNQVPDPPY